MNAHPEITLTDTPDPDDYDRVVKALNAYGDGVAGRPNTRKPLALLLHGKDGEVVGGLWAKLSWNWLYVQTLFIPESLRRQRIGESLMRRAEQEAKDRGCDGVWLDTLSVEAPGFYERMGYTRFAELPGYPPGGAKYFFVKRFPTAA